MTVEIDLLIQLNYSILFLPFSLTPPTCSSDSGRPDTGTKIPVGQRGLEVWEDPRIDEKEAGCEEPVGEQGQHEHRPGDGQDGGSTA